MFTVVVVRRAISTDDSILPQNILSTRTAITSRSQTEISHCTQRARRQTLRPYWTAKPAGERIAAAESGWCTRGKS